MATKAVCVLKGDGPVQGTIYFELKARAGAGRAAARPCRRTCALQRAAGELGLGRPSPRPRRAGRRVPTASLPRDGAAPPGRYPRASAEC